MGFNHLVSGGGHGEALVEAAQDLDGILAGPQIGHYEIEGALAVQLMQEAMVAIEFHQTHTVGAHRHALIHSPAPR
jgi:hypothetical protein